MEVGSGAIVSSEVRTARSSRLPVGASNGPVGCGDSVLSRTGYYVGTPAPLPWSRFHSGDGSVLCILTAEHAQPSLSQPTESF